MKVLIEVLEDSQIIQLHNQESANRFLSAKLTAKMKDRGCLEGSPFYVKGLAKGYEKASSGMKACRYCGKIVCDGTCGIRYQKADQAKPIKDFIKQEQDELRQNINFLLKRAYKDPTLLNEDADELSRLIS